MSQIYNGNTKRPELKENQLASQESYLGNLHILLEIQQRALGPGESAAWTMYVFENTPKQLSGSGKGAVGAQ